MSDSKNYTRLIKFCYSERSAFQIVLRWIMPQHHSVIHYAQKDDNFLGICIIYKLRKDQMLCSARALQDTSARHSLIYWNTQKNSMIKSYNVTKILIQSTLWSQTNTINNNHWRSSAKITHEQWNVKTIAKKCIQIAMNSIPSFDNVILNQ